MSKPWVNVADAVLANAGLHPRVAALSDDFHATLQLVAAGRGAALVLQLALAARPAGVTAVQVPELKLTRKLMVLSAEDAPADLVERLVEGCKSVLPAD